MPHIRLRCALMLLAVATAGGLGGCAVVSVGAGAVGLAADAAIGTARIGGKVIGATADAVIPYSK